jgi:hypothetical protein
MNPLPPVTSACLMDVGAGAIVVGIGEELKLV